MGIRERSAVLILGLLVFNTSGLTQTVNEPEDEKTIKVRTSLVNIPLIVSDGSGQRISGLTREDFRLRVNSQDTKIEFFADTNEQLSFAILLDTSGSTGNIRGKLNGAARSFVDTTAEFDRGSVVRFDDNIKVLIPWTENKSKIKYAIGAAETVSGGIGLMNEALARVIEKEFQDSKGRKVVILLTDGGEINLETNSVLQKLLASSDVVVYPIIYQSGNLLQILRRSNSEAMVKEIAKLKSIMQKDLVRYGPFDHLEAVARITGGRLLFADGDNFEIAFQSIADELRKQYVIGFYVDADSGPDRREISIKVNRPDTVIRTKQTIKVRNEPEIDSPRLP